MPPKIGPVKDSISDARREDIDTRRDLGNIDMSVVQTVGEIKKHLDAVSDKLPKNEMDGLRNDLKGIARSLKYKDFVDAVGDSRYQDLLKITKRWVAVKPYTDAFKKKIDSSSLPSDDQEIFHFLVDTFHSKLAEFTQRVQQAVDMFSRKVDAADKKRKIWPGIDPTPKAKATASELLIKAKPLIEKLASVASSDPSVEPIQLAFTTLEQKVKTDSDLKDCRDELSAVVKTMMNMKVDKQYATNRSVHSALDNALTAMTPVVKIYKTVAPVKTAQYKPVDFEKYRTALIHMFTEGIDHIHRVWSDLFDKGKKAGEKHSQLYPAIKSGMSDLAKANQRMVDLLADIHRLRVFDPMLIPPSVQKAKVADLLHKAETELNGARLYYHEHFDRMYEVLTDIIDLSEKVGNDAQSQDHLIRNLYLPFKKAMDSYNNYAVSLLDARGKAQSQQLKKAVSVLSDLSISTDSVHGKLYNFYKIFETVPVERLPKKSAFLIELITELGKDAKTITKCKEIEQDVKDNLVALLDQTVNNIKTYLGGLKQLEKN